MLLRSLRSLLPEARDRVHYVKLTSLSKRDLCREIAAACGLDITGTYPVLMHKLQHAFRSQSDDDGLRPVLLLDESQDLRPEVLASLRLLTNFEMDSRLVLSLVLAGDTQLRPLLNRAELEPIRRRMAHFVALRLLSRAEAEFHPAEIERFGFSHFHVGWLPAGKWRVPNQLAEAILYHRESPAESKYPKHAAAVPLANLAMRVIQVGFLRNSSLKIEESPPALYLRLDAAVLRQIAA